MLYRTSAELRAIVSPALLATGCVNVIGLDGIKNHMGAQWPQLRHTVYARLEALFHAKLGPTDFFIRIDDSSYLLAMPSSDPEDVDVVSLRISYDLYTNCLGRCDLGHIQVSSTSVGDGDTLNLELMSFERIIELAEKAGIKSFNMPVANEPLSPEPGEAAGQAAAPAVSLIKDSSHKYYVEHQYVPVWDTVNAAVTAYICEPKSIYAEPQRELISYVLLSPKERAQVEISCLQAGGEQIAKTAQTVERFLLSLTVPFDVLASPSDRMDYLAACRELAADYRQYIHFMLIDVPPGVAQTRLSNMVNLLRPFCRQVSATVAPQTRVYAAYQGIGLRAIGFDLRQFCNGHCLRRQDADQLARNARYANLATFFRAADDDTALEIARSAGIQYLSGGAAAPACDEPHGMWRFSWSDLSKRQLAS